MKSFASSFRRFIQRALIVLSFCGIAEMGWGQVLIPNTTPVIQNFDGMAATTTLPTNWRMHASTISPTWAAASATVTQQASSGSPTNGGTYNFGSSASERAVGAMTSGSFASPNNLIGFFQNTNASSLTSLTIAYDAERYRINTAAASVQFFYSLNGTAWTAVTAGDIATSSFPTGSSTYNFATGTIINKTGISITGLNIATNGSFYLRWNINTTGSSSQGIAIDNISVTAAFAAATPTITSSGTLSATNTTYGTASASPTSFNVSGANMSAGILVTPPAGYEVSLASGSGYASTVTVGAAGTIASTPVYVRLKSDATVAGSPYSGNIALTSSGATPVNVATVSSTVGAKALTVSASAQTKTEGSTSPTTGTLNTHFTVSGLENGNTANQVTLAYSGSPAGNLTTATPGSYTITPSALTLSSGSTSNYSISYNTGTLTINAASTPTLNSVTLSSALSSIYGTASIGGSFTASGSNLTGNITATAQSDFQVSTDNISFESSVSVVSGTTVWVRFASTRSAGSYNGITAVVLSGGGASSDANVTTSSSGNTVAQKNLTISGLTAQNKVYDGLTAATASGTPTLSGVVSPDVVALTDMPIYTFINASVGNGITVNTSNYSLTGAQAGNYSLTQPTLSANITPRPLTITANNVTKMQGVLLSGGAGSTAFTSSGLQNSETIGSVTIAYGSAGATTGDGNTVGVYASQVTPSAATGGTFTASNYSISYVAGSITVTASPVVIAIQDFETSPETPIWTYSATGGAINSTTNKFNGAISFRLINSEILTMDNITVAGYSDVVLSVAFAAEGPDSGEDLFMDISYDNGSSWIGTGSIKLVDGFSNTPLNINTTNALDPTTVGSNPWSTSIAGSETQIRVRFRVVGLEASEYYWIDDVKVTGVPIPTAPILTTPTATSITTNSATLGATITSDGGVTITSRGTVYGTSASPTVNSEAEGGTSVATFTHSRTSLTANTFYYYRGYATNSIGTGYSADGTFTTLPLAPTVGSGSNATTTTIDASWTAATGGSATFTYEIEVDDNNDFSSPTFTQSSISSATTTITATGLTSNTTYYFRVRANNAGGNSAWSSSSPGYATLEAVNPTLSTTALEAFGNICLNVTSAANSFTINGSALTSADVSVSSLSGFTFSTTVGGTYTSSLTLPQAGGTFAQAVYVKFTPTAVQSYDGNIVVSGGGASTSENVAASGSGISGTVNVTTTAASAISTTGASTGGSSVSTSCGTITSKGVAYGTTANPTTPVTSDGSGSADY
jgi:hypothetical protein